MAKLLPLLIAMIVWFPSTAQSFNTPIDETSLELKVKQIDEFMHRFNFDIHYDGAIPTDSTSRDERLGNMYTVFRLKNFRNAAGQPDSLMTTFCEYVIDNDIRLEYENCNWNAEVICNAKMGNRKLLISLFLMPENIRDVLYKWVLVDVKSDFLKPLLSEVKDSLFISPAEHGISFITLPRIINLSVSDINSVFNKNWVPDPLSVFSYLISSKQLVLTSVNEVIYHWTLNDYAFDVERFEGEDTPNKGWLISKIIPLTHSKN